MTSSAKKKKEKKKDFQKTKLKVGKARPKNTNATDTSFSAKSIVFRQQSLSETGRDSAAALQHALSLLSSKSDTQRRDALAQLVTLCGPQKAVHQSITTVVAKVQPLILDGSAPVRQQLLKLLRSLPSHEIGPVDQLLLYTRAGMAHLSAEIRMSSLDVLDWIAETNGAAAVSCAGGWTKTLRTFQNLLSWHADRSSGAATSQSKWSAASSSSGLGNGRLLVHQLTTLSRFLAAGLMYPPSGHISRAGAQTAVLNFPLWHTESHMLPMKTDPFGYLNLFGAARHVESEIYETREQRTNVFLELGLREAFSIGTWEAKKEGGEVGRAAALVEQTLKLVDDG